MSVSQDQSVHTESSVDGDLRKIESVRTIFASLSKYVLGKKVYASNNPNLKRFAESFGAACADYFAHEDELLLIIDKFCILWRGEVVYENTKRDESIAFLLFKDGVGEVRILNAVSENELERFVDIIKEETHNYSPERDIVTALWCADFDNIQYRVFDEYMDSDYSNARRDEAASESQRLEADDHQDLPNFADKGRIIAGSYAVDRSLAEYFDGVITLEHPVADGHERELHLQALLRSQLAVSDEEFDEIRGSLDRDRAADALVRFFVLMLDFARKPKESHTVHDFSGIIESLVQYIVSERDVHALTEVLRSTRRFVSTHTIPDERHSFFRSIEESFADKTVLQSLAATAKRSKKDAKAVFAYYRLAGKSAIPVLCELLQDTDAPWFHADVCRTLVGVAGDEIHSIIGRLDIDKPSVARGVIFMLRELESMEIPRIIEELVYYPDVAVKEEAAKYLASVGSDAAARLAAAMLDDDDKHVRMKTLAAVEMFSHPIIIKKVESAAFDPDLDHKDIDEQERIFRALGNLMGTRALPRIKEFVKGRSLFSFRKRGGDKRNKVLAIRALEHIHGAESMKFLEAFANDSDALIRSLAQRASARLAENPRPGTTMNDKD